MGIPTSNKSPLPVTLQASPAPATESSSSASIPLSSSQELEKQLRDDPFNLELHERLVRLYVQAGRLTDARRAVGRAVALPTAGADLQQLAEDVEILWLRQQLEQAQSTPGAERGDGLSAAQWSRQLLRQEILAYLRRVEHQPNDAALRYELGRRLRRAGRFRPALVHLKKAAADPAHACRAYFEVACCCELLGRPVQALQAYRHAAMARPADAATRKEALYRAGILAMSRSMPDCALEYFRYLVSMDPRYRDVEQRLRQLDQPDQRHPEGRADSRE